MSFGSTKHLAPAINRFLATKKVVCSEEQAALVVELAKEMYGAGLDNFIGPPWVEGRHPVTASSATRCLLQQWFKHNKFPKEPFAPRVNATFRMGHIVETELYLLGVLAGEVFTEYQHQATILRAGWPTNNYIDWIHTSKVDGKRRVVDAKSMGDFGYKKLFEWNKPMDDTFGYLGQMSTYIDYALDKGLVDSNEGIFLCYDKNKGNVDEYIYEMDPALVGKAEVSSKIIQDHTQYETCGECVDGYRVYPSTDGSERKDRCSTCTGVPIVVVGASDSRRPERPEEYGAVKVKGGWGLQTVPCGYCDFKWSCWTRPHQRVEFGSTGDPEYDEAPEQSLRVSFDSKGKPTFNVEAG